MPLSSHSTLPSTDQVDQTYTVQSAHHSLCDSPYPSAHLPHTIPSYPTVQQNETKKVSRLVPVSQIHGVTLPVTHLVRSHRQQQAGHQGSASQESSICNKVPPWYSRFDSSEGLRRDCYLRSSNAISIGCRFLRGNLHCLRKRCTKFGLSPHSAS